MEQGIKFVITGDTSGLQSAEKQAAKTIDDLNKKINILQKEIAENIKISQGYEKAIADLSAEFKRGTITQTQYAKSLDRLQRDEKETQVETQRLRRELSALNKDQRSLSGAYPKLSKNVNTYAKSQRNASAGAVEFGRLLGDLPYGIQGVANNIQQLAFVMGGGAGLQIGVALVTSALVAFGDELFKSSKATDALVKSTAEFTSQVKSEIATLNSLLAIARDENQSKLVRQKAIEQINDDYSDYLGNLSLETVRTDEVRGAIDKLTKSLILKARVQGLESAIQDTIADREEEIRDLSLDRAQAYRDVNSELQRLKSSSAFFKDVIKDSNSVQENIDAVAKATNGLDNAQLRTLKSTITNFKSLDKQLKNTNKEVEEAIAPLIASQTSLQVLKFKTDIEVEGVTVTPEAQKERDKIVTGGKEKLNSLLLKLDKQLFKEEQDLAKESAEKMVSDVSEIFANSGGLGAQLINAEQIEADAAKSEEAILKFENAVKSIEETFDNISLGAAISEWIDGLNDSDITPFQERLNKIGLTAAVANNAVASAFQGMTAQISSSLETGNQIIDSFVGSLVSSLGQMLSALAQSAIQQIAINQATATSSAIAGGAASGAGTGPAAIFTTPAFIAALVGLVGAAFAGIATSFAQGGMIGGGSFTGDKIPILANSGEYVLTQQDQGFLTNFLRGNTGQTTNRVQSDGIVATYVVRGQDQLVTLRRAQQFNKRFDR